MLSLILGLLGLIILFLMAGFETALFSANKLRLEMDLKKDSFLARIIHPILDQPAKIWAVIQVSQTLALLVAGFNAFLLFAQREPNQSIFILAGSFTVSFIILVVLWTYAAKILARRFAIEFLKIAAYPVYFIYLPLLLFIRVQAKWPHYFLPRLMKMHSPEFQLALGEEKVEWDKWMENGTNGSSDDSEADSEVRIFQNALDFTELKVRDCMIPRTEIVAVEQHDSIDKLTKLFIQTGLSRILVYRENIDQIIGYFKYSELFDHPESIESKLVEIPIIPESMGANVLLAKFIQEKKNIAVVVDEFGGTAGVVSLEDIMEEIFGDIEDEHDYIRLTETRLNEKEFIFSGRLEVDYLNETYELNLPEEEEFNTLAGYILHHSPHIPKKGDLVETERFYFRILKVSETRIELVNLKVK